MQHLEVALYQTHVDKEAKSRLYDILETEKEKMSSTLLGKQFSRSSEFLNLYQTAPSEVKKADYNTTL